MKYVQSSFSGETAVACVYDWTAWRERGVRSPVFLIAQSQPQSSLNSFTGTLDAGTFHGIPESPRHVNECQTAISALRWFIFYPPVQSNLTF